MIRSVYGQERAKSNPDADNVFADHIAAWLSPDGQLSYDGLGVPLVVRGIAFTGNSLTASEDITAVRGILSRTLQNHRTHSDIARAIEIGIRINEVLYQDPAAHDFTLMTSSFHGAMRTVFGLTYVEQVAESAQRLQLFTTA